MKTARVITAGAVTLGLGIGYVLGKRNPPTRVMIEEVVPRLISYAKAYEELSDEISARVSAEDQEPIMKRLHALNQSSELGRFVAHAADQIQSF